MYKIEKSYLSGNVKIPSSKSHTIRALFCASLTRGKTKLLGEFEGEDIQETVTALRELGIKIEYRKNVILIDSTSGYINQNPNFTIKESATTFRMILPIVALNCKKYTFTLGNKLVERPHADILNFLNKNGASIEIVGNKLSGIGIEKLVDTSYCFGESSQGFSGILIAFSFKGVHLGTLRGEIPSKSYVNLTKEVLEVFGYKLTERYQVIGKSKRRGKYRIPGDYSTLANYLALNRVGNKIKCKYTKGNHPDRIYAEYLSNEVEKVNIENSIDLIFPVLYTFINSSTPKQIEGIDRAQYKESNRVEEGRKILEAISVKYEMKDGITIYPSEGWKESKHSFTSSNDHRCDMIKVMICTQTGGEIDRVDSINKSHPSFISNLIKLGCKIEEV